MRKWVTRLAGVSLLAVLVWVGWPVIAKRQSVEPGGAVTAVAEFERSGASYKGFERGEALITVEELNRRIRADDPNLVVLAVVNPISYRAGHIAGSINVWRPDYEPPKGDRYPFDGMMVNRDEFQELARTLGVDNDSEIVVYDDRNDATRVWWAFYLYGKTDVRVLDGGYPAWKAAGYDTDLSLTRGSADRRGNFVAESPRQGWKADMDDVWQAQASEDIQLWDTREPEEWSGARTVGNARRGGRVPWANFQNWREYRVALDDTPLSFKTAPEIQAVIDEFGMSPDKDQIFYCQSGVRTTTAIFTLYLMGWDPDRLHNYDGSWLEWSYDEDNPIAVGEGAEAP
jgi:thiosulfate/3-mercaptopyruvate sulfurtransferase